MTQDEIIEMARKAGFVTNEIKSYVISPYTFEDQDLYQELEAFAKLITEKAIKEALAQPEPVVFCMHWEDRWGCNHYVDQKEPHPINAKPLYTSPTQRKPLTDKEILAANYPDGEENGPTIAAPDFELICFARQIEAAHGIKE
jgi:hypothetical protein